jgi:O-antigen ligase
LLFNWVELLGFFDRDPTLSARTLIWNYVIVSKIPAHPYLGYGKGTFWSSDILTSGFESAANHIPSHAHNGFLDLILEVGLIGFSIFLIVWSIAYIRAIN